MIYKDDMHLNMAIHKLTLSRRVSRLGEKSLDILENLRFQILSGPELGQMNLAFTSFASPKDDIQRKSHPQRVEKKTVNKQL